MKNKWIITTCFLLAIKFATFSIPGVSGPGYMPDDWLVWHGVLSVKSGLEGFRYMVIHSLIFSNYPPSHLNGSSFGAIFTREGITGDPFRRSDFRRADSIIMRYCSLVIGRFALFARRALIKAHCLSLHTSLGTDLTQSADFLTNQFLSLLFC